MYLFQQHTYSENNNYHGAKIENSNGIFFIENQQLMNFIPSVHQRIVTSSQSSALTDSHLLPTMGYTTHMIDNDLVSFFGKPDQPSVTMIQTQYSPPSILLPCMLTSSPSSSPSRRYAHTTTIVQSANSTVIFLIGGSTIQDDIPQFDIWKLEWDTKRWINLDVRAEYPVPGLMGHVTLVLPRRSSTHLLTCFGANPLQHVFFDGCSLFNTSTLHWKLLKHNSSSVAHPAPRIYASMIPANDTHVVLYGGQSTSTTLLDDIWWLPLENIDAMVSFILLGHSLPRAGHSASMLSDNRMLVYGGKSDFGEHDTVLMDLTDQGKPHYQKRQLTLLSAAAGDMVAQGSGDDSSKNGAVANGISGGAIGGIIVAVLAILALSVLGFIWYQRRKRRQRNYDMHSRAARFSLSTPPRPSGSDTEQRTSTMTIQHPEAAKTRISHMSFGSEFGVGLGGPGAGSRSSLPINPSNDSTHSINNHPNLLDSPSRQLYTNWVCEAPPPPPMTTAQENKNTSSSNNTRKTDSHHTFSYINQSTPQNTTPNDCSDIDTENVCLKKGSGTTFDRLRLSVFKPLDIVAPITEHKNRSSSNALQQHPKELLTSSFANQAISPNATGQPDETLGDDTAKRRSSMFGLSKFLNLGESNTGTSRVSDQDSQRQPGTLKRPLLSPPQRRQSHSQPPDHRESLGSKSVASLQWVEFNSEMDVNGHLTSRNLAVMNHRQSSATISSGSGFSSGLGGPGSVDDLNASSRPTSPRDIMTMAQQLQQQHRHIRQQQQQHDTYRLSQRELQSWEDARLSRLVPPSPHRLATPSKSNN